MPDPDPKLPFNMANKKFNKQCSHLAIVTLVCDGGWDSEC